MVRYFTDRLRNKISFLKGSMVITYRFYYIIWNDKFTYPLRILFKSYSNYQKGGIEALANKINQEYYTLKLQQQKKPTPEYTAWIEQNEKEILKTEPLQYRPLISIITPVYNTDPKYLKEMFESVLSQTYSNWQLCIADDASDNPKTLQLLKEYEQGNSRIEVVHRDTNGHICKASNSALKLARGEYVVFLDHDDMLAPHALYGMIKKLNENRDLKLIYSDEDKIDEKGQRFAPHFKSGWNPDMFYSQNYICHLTLLDKKIVDKIGGFRNGYEGSQDYELLLRAIPHIKDHQIDRVQEILYHWRAIKGSTAYSADEKSYTHVAGQKALQDHFDSINPAIRVKDGMLPNTYRVCYPLPDPAPLVSLIIPTRDHYDLIHACIQGILAKTRYPNYEIIIIDNETICPKTLRYFEELKKNPHISIIEYHQPFNYSAINNFGVKHAKGEIIAFVNNDIEVISEGWLTEMVSHALRPEIGAVGAKLYYDDLTLQHAGVILGIGGVAGHSHKYFEQNAHGYFSRLKIIQNYSAVTGACLVVKKSIFEEVGRFDETNLTIAFNDVDLCLKIRQKGYRNLWTPYANLYHHESKTRGQDDTEEKKERFQNEVLYMQSKWGNLLKNDLYYNKNLSHQYENFSISKNKESVS